MADGKILVDSSAWIEYFKGSDDFLFIADLLKDTGNPICTNDVVLTELMPSMTHRKEEDFLTVLRNAAKVPLTIDWIDLRKLQLHNYQNGNNNVSIPDLIIVQNCIQKDLTLLARDKHFALMAQYLDLKVY
jgi:predicted nucleic acid-binding protein